MTREPFSAPMYGYAIVDRLRFIAGQFEAGTWDNKFHDVAKPTMRLIPALLREIATAIDEECRK